MNCRLIKKGLFTQTKSGLLLTSYFPRFHRSASANNFRYKKQHKNYSLFPHTSMFSHNNDTTFISKKRIQSSFEGNKTTTSVRIKQRKNYHKIKRAVNFHLQHNPLYGVTIVEKVALGNKMKKLKGKFNSLLTKSHVYNREMYKKVDRLFHKGDESSQIKKEINNELNRESIKSESSKNFRFKYTPELFSKQRTYFRYEDYCQSPSSFLTNNFLKNEIDVIVSSPQQFKLRSGPFKGAKIKIINGLRDLLEKEEGNSTEQPKDKETAWLYQNINENKNRKNINFKRPVSSAVHTPHKPFPREEFDKSMNPYNNPNNSTGKHKKNQSQSMVLSSEKTQTKMKEMEQRRNELIEFQNKIFQNKNKNYLKIMLSNMENQERTNKENHDLKSIQLQITNNYSKSSVSKILKKSK